MSEQLQQEGLSSSSSMAQDLARQSSLEYEPVSPLQELQLRREEYNDLMEQSQSNIQIGDKYYAVPMDWLNKFLYDDFSNDKSQIGEIYTNQLLDETGLCLTTRKTCAFVPELGFTKLCEWYGLAENNNVIEREIIMDDHGQFKIEAYPLFISPHFLCGDAALIHRYTMLKTSNFLISSHATTKELKDRIKDMFDISRGHVTKLWFIKTDLEETPTILIPGDLDSIIEKIQIPVVGKRQQHPPITLADKKIHSGHFLLEITQKDGTFIMDSTSLVEQGNGLVGLNNLGNTCYMNSALQCLVHIPELSDYFLYNYFEPEINTDNPLGNNGKVAMGFASLVKHLFDKRMAGPNTNSYAPRDFKYTIGHFNSIFSGYQQQDSQELIAFLLDGLHEDLNRVIKKPYVEMPELPDDKVNDPIEIAKLAQDCWNTHKLRNDSIIIDLFVGLYKSTLVCPECDKVSITFDPYNDLTLPLPLSRKWYHNIKILLEDGPPRLLGVELNKSSTFYDLKQYISNKIDVPMNELIALEIFQSQVYKNFESKDSDTRYLPISDLINDTDDIWFHQISHKPGDMVVPVFNTLNNSTSSSYHLTKAFGIPFFITVSEDERFSFGAIREKLEKRYGQLSTYGYFKNVREQSKYRHTKEDFPLLNQTLGNDDEEDDLISLANPDLPGDYGFDIKIFDSSKESHKRGYGSKYSRYSFYNHYGQQQQQSDDDDDDSLWIPQTSDNFKDLPSLLDKVSPKKKAYYTYDTMVNQADDDKWEVVVKNESKSDSLIAIVPSIPNSSSSIELPEVIPLSEQDDDNGEEETTKLGPLIENSEESNDVKLIATDEDANNSDSMDMCELITPSSDSISQVMNDTNSSSAEQQKSISPMLIDTPMEEGELEDSQTEQDLEESLYSGPLIEEKNALVCDWDPQSFDTFFTGVEDEGKGGKETWTKPLILRNIELEESKKRLLEQSKRDITLEDCLDLFSLPEVLSEQDLWYCPKCKEHRQATKKIQIWSVPDILTIHLKRFENTKSFSDKIDAIVNFPIEGLELSKYVVGSNGKSLIYDLFAVDNHYGGLGGGHYTAYVKNFIDNKWYYYDDSRVSPADPVNSIKGSAYLLFYRRRSSKALGGEFFNKMFKEITSEREKHEQASKKLLEQQLLLQKQEQFTEKINEETALISPSSLLLSSNHVSDNNSTASIDSTSTTCTASPTTNSGDHKTTSNKSDDIISPTTGNASHLQDDAGIKRRKMMFKKHIDSSNIGSPSSDFDDAASVYSNSANAPVSNPSSEDHGFDI